MTTCISSALALALLVPAIVQPSASGAAARQPDGALVVADFDGDKIETRFGLAPWLFADEQMGGTSEARVELIHPGANGSAGALRVRFHVTADSPVPFAGAWLMVGPDGMATDLTGYQGVRFALRSKDATAFTAGIVRFEGRIQQYSAPLEIGPEWTMVALTFGKFRQMTPTGAPAPDAPALDPKKITSVGIGVAPSQRGDLIVDLDRVEFYR